MTIAELWHMTMNDADLGLRWAAVEVLLIAIQTVFIIVSLAVVFIQIRHIQKEAIEKKIAGLEVAVRALDIDLFAQVSKQAATGTAIWGANWRKLLGAINFVAILIDQQFTNRQLLLAIKGKELYTIGAYIDKNGLPVDIEPDLDDQLKPAMDLLKYVKSNAAKLGYLE